MVASSWLLAERERERPLGSSAGQLINLSRGGRKAALSARLSLGLFGLLCGSECLAAKTDRLSARGCLCCVVQFAPRQTQIGPEMRAQFVCRVECLLRVQFGSQMSPIWSWRMSGAKFELRRGHAALHTSMGATFFTAVTQIGRKNGKNWPASGQQFLIFPRRQLASPAWPPPLSPFPPPEGPIVPQIGLGGAPIGRRGNN